MRMPSSSCIKLCMPARRTRSLAVCSSWNRRASMSRDRRGVHARECLRADVPAAARRERDGRVGRRARSPPARAGRGAIDYDCAHGSLAGPLRTDGEARFVTTGFYVREHGGPIREGEPIDSVPATYLGSVVGDRMTLRAVAGTDTLGPPAGRHTAALQVSLSAGHPSVGPIDVSRTHLSGLGTTPSAPPAHRGPASLGIRSGV